MVPPGLPLVGTACPGGASAVAPVGEQASKAWWSATHRRHSLRLGPLARCGRMVRYRCRRSVVAGLAPFSAALFAVRPPTKPNDSGDLGVKPRRTPSDTEYRCSTIVGRAFTEYLLSNDPV